MENPSFRLGRGHLLAADPGAAATAEAPRWAPRAHPWGAAAPVLDPSPPAARGGVCGFPAPPRFGNPIAPQCNFRAPGSGVPGGSVGQRHPEAGSGRDLAGGGARAARPEPWRQRARGGRPGGPGARGLGFPGSAAAWPATRRGGKGAAGSLQTATLREGGGWGARGMPPQSYFKHKSQAMGHSGHLRNSNEPQPPPTHKHNVMHMCFPHVGLSDFPLLIHPSALLPWQEFRL